MSTQHRSKSLAFGIPGLILQIGCMTLSRILAPKTGEHTEWFALLAAGSLIGVLLLIVGLRHYAKAKGYGSEWGLLGIFSLLGILILVALPDKTKY
jgi:LPXTG-motif cell wall-anchored protein